MRKIISKCSSCFNGIHYLWKYPNVWITFSYHFFESPVVFQTSSSIHLSSCLLTLRFPFIQHLYSHFLLKCVNDYNNNQHNNNNPKNKKSSKRVTDSFIRTQSARRRGYNEIGLNNFRYMLYLFLSRPLISHFGITYVKFYNTLVLPPTSKPAVNNKVVCTIARLKRVCF